jgi:thiamine-phosphate pyrophosphorylase
VAALKEYTLYLVLSSDSTKGRPVLDIARQAVQSGIDMLQMREKNFSQGNLLSLGEKLLPLCKKQCIPFIVNDNPYLAKTLNADGVHLGQEDIKKYTLKKAREILGPEKLIGISTHSIGEFSAANGQDFDYIAYGPIFPTKTKDYCIGTVGIEEVLKLSSKPVIFIGGINAENMHTIVEKGAKNIAVIRAVTEADDIAKAVQSLKDKLKTPSL